MANEFKVKKGLIVDGSGGTLLDVQGSVGQVFSVTDSLTGDIFSVSDVSGIPIFNVNSDGTVTIDGNIKLADNDKIQLGDDQDLKLYHDGSNSYINETGTGDLIIKGGNDIIFKDAVDNLLVNMNQSNSVELYYGGAKKFETTNSGVNITGGGSFSTSVTASGNSNSFGNTTIAALAATSGTFSASVTAAGNSNSFGTTTFTGDVTADNITSTSNSGDASIYINSSRPTLGFTDTNSFTDPNDIYLIRAGNDILQFQYYDDSASSTTETFNITSAGNATFAGAISTPTGSTFAGAIKITETGTAQHILIGNQDSSGADKPAMIQGVNGQIKLGYGNSWTGEGGTFTAGLTLDVSSNAAFAGTVTAPQHFKASGNNLSLSAGAVQVLNIDLNRNIYPNTDNSTDLGFSATQLRFRNGYFTGDMYVGDNLVMTGEHPTISFLDTNTNADDFYIHINSNNFYILTNRTDSPADQVNTGWETPHVFQLEADTNIGYLFGHRIFNENYHPNADIWTTARTITLGGDLSGSVSINGFADVTLTAAVANDSHTHDGRYFTESESNAKFLTKDGSAKEWVFEVNDEGSISGNKWYKVATVNQGSGGLHIRGHISNHVETFGSQKFDLAIQGRETNPTVEVNGQVDIFHNATGAGTDKCGIRVVRATDETYYDKFDVWIRTTRYTQVRLHLTKSGGTSFHTSPTVVTTEPAPLSPVTTPEIDTSTYVEGGYIIVDSLAALSCKTTGTSVVGSLTAAADVIAYSDERLKENVKTLDGSKVLQMRGVSFDRLDNGKYSSGVIAQELEKVAPELVIDDGKYKGVAYGNITGYLIEAIKEQQKQINELKKLIKDGNNL